MLSTDDRQFLLFAAQCPLAAVSNRAEVTLLKELKEIDAAVDLEILHRRCRILAEVEELERRKSQLQTFVDEFHAGMTKPRRAKAVKP